MMKKPSRTMPKYVEKPSGFSGKLILVALVCLMAWLMWTYPLTLAMIPIVMILEVRDRMFRKKHFENLLKDREADSIGTFSRHFEFRKIDTWVIRAVYEQLQAYMTPVRKSFPIRPDDDVFKDLLIDDEDFDLDIIEEIAERTGRSLEHIESNPYYGKASVVENLVYFFNEQPEVNPT
ncbi:MAG: hypothetical protein P8171_08920 [Candidatus Thiodiazotropha sp.]|jgi:hypothetical protein